MTLAGSSTLSDVVLPIAGVLAALLVGAATAWATYVVGFPKRRLFYSMPLIAPLLADRHGAAGGLTLSHQGIALTQPYVVELQLIGRGRKDIPRSAFDGEEPIQMDLGVPIIAVLQVTSEPKIVTPPKVAIDGTAIKIGPSLISNRQKIVISVLTEGGHPCLSWQSSLENVKIQRRNAGSRFEPVFFWGMAVASVYFGVTSALAVSAAGTWVMSVPSWATPLQAVRVSFTTVGSVAIIVAFLATVTALALQRRRQRRLGDT